MSGIRTYQSLRNLVTRFRDDLNSGGQNVLLLFAYNRTGKTRLSMEFKDVAKRRNNGDAETLYFNAYTEDLFIWHNDLEEDTDRHLLINTNSAFFDGLEEMEMDNRIRPILQRYVDFDFRIFPEASKIVFSETPFSADEEEEKPKIKISRGEENIFKWCFFLAIAELVVDGAEAYNWVKYLYIDDPISSLDDNHAISIACDLAKLLRRAASRRDDSGDPSPVKVVFSSHHALFFNVMCNEIGRSKENEPKVEHKRYFLHRPNSEGRYTLRATEDSPYFHHVASLSELQRAADPDAGTLYTFHFNALRSIMEKTSSFFGHKDISFCLKALDNEEDQALFNRALNLLSHGKYAIHEPTVMGEDNQELFRRILREFVERFQFELPEILNLRTTASS